MSDNAKGAALMTGSMAAFTVNDACLKALSTDLPFFQAVFMRGVAVCLLMLLLGRLIGPLRFDLPPRDWGLVALRSLAEIGAAWFYINALFNMPLANAAAILQALPLAVTLGGALVFREPVGWRRWTAILIGFMGVLLIVRPGAEGFTIYSVYALLSVLCVTVRDLATRRLSPGTPSVVVALAGAGAVTLFAATGAAVTEWVPVSPSAAAKLAGAVVFVIAGYLLSVLVMRVGEIGFVAPFRYTSLVWALALGFLVFGEWPEPLTLAGAAVVVATGLFTLYRERQRGRALAQKGGLRT